MVPVRTPAVDLNWLPGVAHKPISEVERDYRPYRGTVYDDAGHTVYVPADIVDDVDDVFAQKAL